MPVITFSNQDNPWVAAALVWGGTKKNFTMQAGSPKETVDSQGQQISYAWKAKNEVVTTAEFDAYAIDLDVDQEIIYGTPLAGEVPVDS